MMMLYYRIEVCKPLGKIEILPVPYVTENRRINILLPVRVHDRASVNKFLQQYKSVCLEKKEKTFLMLVINFHVIITLYRSGLDQRLFYRC